MRSNINTQAQIGDIAQLISAQNKRFIFRIVKDGKFELTAVSSAIMT